MVRRVDETERARPARALAWLLASVSIALVGSPGAARAWTDAAVRSVRAEVVLSPDATAHVTLHALVRVHGGWLEGMELAGLDPDLALDEAFTPTAVDQSGQTFSPEVSVVGEGRLAIVFRGRSPRRGHVTVSLAYRTSLAHRATEPLEGQDRVRVRWTLPGWRSGLDGVQIDVHAPDGAERGPSELGERAVSMTTSVEESATGTHLRWRRAHLPRTVPWTVAVDVPTEQMDASLRGPLSLVAPLPPAPSTPARAAPSPRPFYGGLAVALLLMALAKMIAVRQLARRARSEVRALVPAPAWLRAPLAAGAAIGLAAVGPEEPFVAVGLGAAVTLLATHRRGPAPPLSQLGAWRAADLRWLRLGARAAWRPWLAPSTLLDLTTPLGVVHLGAWVAAAVALDGQAMEVPRGVLLLAALLPLPLLLTGTRRAFPLGPAAALARMLRFVRALAALPGGVALRPVLHVDVRGEVQDARVRTVLSHRPDGLLRCDLAMLELPHLGGWDAELGLVVVTRANSPVEIALAEALPEVEAEPSRGGRRVLRTLPIARRSADELARVVDAIHACPAGRDAPRGQAAQHETIRDLPTPRAVGL